MTAERQRQLASSSISQMCESNVNIENIFQLFFTMLWFLSWYSLNLANFILLWRKYNIFCHIHGPFKIKWYYINGTTLPDKGWLGLWHFFSSYDRHEVQFLKGIFAWMDKNRTSLHLSVARLGRLKFTLIQNRGISTEQSKPYASSFSRVY